MADCKQERAESHAGYAIAALVSQACNLRSVIRRTIFLAQSTIQSMRNPRSNHHSGFYPAPNPQFAIRNPQSDQSKIQNPKSHRFTFQSSFPLLSFNQSAIRNPQFAIVSILCAFILLLSALLLPARADDYLSVTGPCNFEFPADHGAHPGYRTEWWYYTGNLHSPEGRRFGFQLTFFRSQISPPGAEKNWPHPSSAWRTQQVFLGHAAVSDSDGRQHLQAEQAARGAVDLAGVSREGDQIRVFLRDWEARIAPQTQQLRAHTDAFGFNLALAPVKPPVSHGDAGYSRKGSTAERASCYYSFTRLNTRGTLSIGDTRYSVEGLSWMDHEYSTAPLESDLTGWDWFGLQLTDESEIMVYLLRQRGGGLAAASSGTYVDAEAHVRRLARTDLQVQILDTWKSSHSGAVYPAKWRMSIAPLELEITIAPNLADQEMRASNAEGVTYWEGSVSLRGTKAGRAVEGSGYVELTGYAGPLDALK